MKPNKLWLIIILLLVIILFICNLFINEINKNIMSKEKIFEFLVEKYNTKIDVLDEYTNTNNYIVTFYANSRIHYAIFEKIFLNYYELEGLGMGSENRFGIELVDKKYFISHGNKQILKVLYAGVIHDSDIKKLSIRVNDSTYIYDLNNSFLIYEEYTLKANDDLDYKVLFLDQNGNEVPF